MSREKGECFSQPFCGLLRWMESRRACLLILVCVLLPAFLRLSLQALLEGGLGTLSAQGLNCKASAAAAIADLCACALVFPAGTP